MPLLRFEQWFAFLRLEIRETLRLKAFWIMAVILSVVTGYSLIQAVNLYTEASRSALSSPSLARGLSPLDGIFVPTMGAYYLAFTFLLPLIAINAIGREKESGSAKLLLQIPLNLPEIIGLKFLALSLVGLMIWMPGLSAVVGWKWMGGHLDGMEIFCLFSGYALYAWAVIGISFFAAAWTDSITGAGIVALALVLGSWVLDFMGDSSGSMIGSFSKLSMTPLLKSFERGLFTFAAAWQLFTVGIAFFILSIFGMLVLDFKRKWAGTGLVLVVAVFLGCMGSQTRLFSDLSEDKRNSFSPADERALRQITDLMTITVHLSLEDSRYLDFQKNILDKLQRLIPELNIKTYGKEIASDKYYGWINYEYGSQKERSTSNSEEEILPLIYRITGLKVVEDSLKDYPGYPLVVDATNAGFWFYLGLPLIFLGGFVLSGRPDKRLLGR